MVDAVKGTLLWSAGLSEGDLRLPRMTHAIPSPLNVIDLDGDGYADRMYVGDMAAQLWRFDIYNGKKRSELVTGGVIASLGAKDATASAANTRRFYTSPDAAILEGADGRRFMNVAIGSGYRGHPLSVSNEDRFYSIRDYLTIAKMTQDQYDKYTIVKDSDLADITTNFAPKLSSSTPGWKLQLNYPKYQGEKVLSSATTLQNALFFVTYTPSPSETSNVCSVTQGSNRVYAISAFDGSPLPRRDSSTPPPGGTDPDPDEDPLTAEDRFDGLGQTIIATGPTFLVTGKDELTCLSGVEVLDVCRDFNSRIKTYWRQTNAN
jgi:type IV pilus assembly protein PilY1